MRQDEQNFSAYRWPAIAVGLVLATVLILLVVKGISNSKTASTDSIPNTPASTELLTSLSSIPQTVFDAVGAGSASNLPTTIVAPNLTQDGKPQVIYIGAEYCPYCATERWPMVVALSRFGTFSNLTTTHSSSSDVYPNTQTFSFHAATYTSPYLVFTGVETKSNQIVGNSYVNLDALTSDQQTILNTYDAAPFVPANAAGSIPFVAFGGKFLLSGSTYQPSVLQGKTAEQIGAALTNANDPVTQGVLGSANALTAVICSLTGDQPSVICSNTGIQSLKKQLTTSAAK